MSNSSSPIGWMSGAGPVCRLDRTHRLALYSGSSAYPGGARGGTVCGWVLLQLLWGYGAKLQSHQCHSCKAMVHSSGAAATAVRVQCMASVLWYLARELPLCPLGATKLQSNTQPLQAYAASGSHSATPGQELKWAPCVAWRAICVPHMLTVGHSETQRQHWGLDNMATQPIIYNRAAFLLDQYCNKKIDNANLTIAGAGKDIYFLQIKIKYPPCLPNRITLFSKQSPSASYLSQIKQWHWFADTDHESNSSQDIFSVAIQGSHHHNCIKIGCLDQHAPSPVNCCHLSETKLRELSIKKQRSW